MKDLLNKRIGRHSASFYLFIFLHRIVGNVFIGLSSLIRCFYYSITNNNGLSVCLFSVRKDSSSCKLHLLIDLIKSKCKQILVTNLADMEREVLPPALWSKNPWLKPHSTPSPCVQHLLVALCGCLAFNSADV